MTLSAVALDPLERLGMPTATNGSLSYYDFFVHEFWRFVYVQKEVGTYAQTFIEYPPMQKGASFNMEAVKQQIEAAQKRFHKPMRAKV